MSSNNGNREVDAVVGGTACVAGVSTGQAVAGAAASHAATHGTAAVCCKAAALAAANPAALIGLAAVGFGYLLYKLIDD
ncbi:MAG TPA: hypothetical protein VMG10_22050 [Gemmataceae bacterium]|nr:hypothetical protein [Gemmataceae bacterium]